jgi:hypothetical protein
MAKKSVIALVAVGVLASFLAVCLISALQLLAPREMPFGVTGPSPVVDAVTDQYSLSLDLITYASESDLTEAAQRGDIYGGYIPGSSTDTLVTVPAKSFFAEVYVRGGFADAAKKANRTITTTTIAPLPTADRLGAVAGLLLLPTLIGGYTVASLLFSNTQAAAVRGRIAIVIGFSVLVALITGITAGPILGAFPTSHLWSLLPCFALVTAAVGLAAVAIQALAGKLGTLAVAVLFIMVGGAGSGGSGVALLPTYWQKIGALFPPRYAVELYRNVRYFDGNNIGPAIAVLSAYALVSVAVILIVERRRNAATPTADTAAATPTADNGAAEPEPPSSRPRLVPKNLVAPVVSALVLTSLFALNYMSSGHEPIADNMPFGVVGSTSLATAAQGDLFSLKVTEYPNQDAATQAMDRGEIYGALIANSSSPELIVVSTISDVSPLDIAGNFEEAATKAGQTITVKAYAPTPLAPKDPFALVPATLLMPLLISGYLAAALLATAVGAASGRWHGLGLGAFAVATGLVMDLIATYWLKGLPSASFWIVWPIISLIILTVALFAGVMRRLLGPAGILVTMIAILQFGNPSSGGANGVPYLTSFWRDIGPFLPPRNAYLLLRNTVYFDGNGIGQPLTVLLVYTIITAVIIGFLDWYRSPPLSVPGLDAESTDAAAATAVPVGPLP